MMSPLTTQISLAFKVLNFLSLYFRFLTSIYISFLFEVFCLNLHGIGLAEAGLLSSKLSILELGITDNEDKDKILFSPERYIFGNCFHNINYFFWMFSYQQCTYSPLSRQDLVSWKMALEKRYLPEIDRNVCKGLQFEYTLH